MMTVVRDLTIAPLRLRTPGQSKAKEMERMKLAKVLGLVLAAGVVVTVALASCKKNEMPAEQTPAPAAQQAPLSAPTTGAMDVPAPPAH